VIASATNIYGIGIPSCLIGNNGSNNQISFLCMLRLAELSVK